MAFSIIQDEIHNNEQQIAARAYVINEDRFYLFPVFSLEPYFVKLLENDTEPYKIHRLIHLLIQANQRMPQLDATNCYKSDFRFFTEGFVHIIMSTYGTYQVVFNLYSDMIDWEVKKHRQMED